MEDTAQLWTLSFAMFLGSFVAGAVPLTISLSEKSLRLVSIIGAGMLVGTALAVIIPEGVHELYNDHAHGGMHHTHNHKHARASTAQAPIYTGATTMEAHVHEHAAGGLEPHTLIGVSLCLGFVFMLLIDQISGGHSHGPSGDSNNERRTKKATATIGLVVHAAADGIALGAAATTSKSDVEMIVFFAIMLHKAPAAFGLTTFLLSENYERNRIRKHLLAFCVAAPIAAILTFYGLSQGSKEALSNINGTGLAMLFSAGTFLYVATVHILPDLKHSLKLSSLEDGKSASVDHETHDFTKLDLCLLVCGIVSPLFLAALHHH